MDLTQNSELRTLILLPLVVQTRTLMARTAEWATTLLSRLNSYHIEEIQMGIVFSTPDALKVIDWALLEITLARPNLSQLRRLTFLLIHGSDTAEAVTFIKRKLPQCDASGIIHFGVSKSLLWNYNTSTNNFWFYVA
jgi:hypothetical protein